MKWRLILASLGMALLAQTASADLSVQNIKGVCVIVPNLDATDDNSEILTNTYYSATVKTVLCHCRGTCTTKATIVLEDRTGNVMTHVIPTCSDGASDSVPQAVTAGGALVLGEGLAFDVTNTPNPATDTYTICVTYQHSQT